MSPPNKDKLHKAILTNAKQIEKLGLHKDDYVQFLHRLSLSPILTVAHKAAMKLQRLLAEIEFRNAIHGSEAVPVLSSDTSIEIGTTVGKGLPFLVSIREVMHWLISGASGSGKTNLICVVERAIRKLIPCTLIDHKDEGGRFIKNVPNSAYLPIDKQRWNLLCAVDDQTAYIRYVVSLLTRLMALMPVTANAVRAKLLSLCSDKTNLPAISDLAEIFMALVQHEFRSSLLTASRGFDDLAITMGSRWADVREGPWPFNQFDLNVIPLKDVPSAFEYFYISLLMKHMTDRASAKGHSTNLHHIIFFDEALSYMGKEMEPAAGSGRSNQVAEMMRLSRSYGLSIIACVQSITKVQESVSDNASVFVAFRANSETEAKAVCKRLGFPESRYREIMNLETGTAWITSPHCRQPVKLNVPYVDLGSYPSNVEISKRMEPIWDKWDSETVFCPTKPHQFSTIDFRELLGETAPQEPTVTDDPSAVGRDDSSESESAPFVEAVTPHTPKILAEYFALLRSCEANPDFAATAHYKALGWSPRKGTRVKAKLIELGWIEALRIASSKAGRPRETARLTEKGRSILDESA